MRRSYLSKTVIAQITHTSTISLENYTLTPHPLSGVFRDTKVYAFEENILNYPTSGVFPLLFTLSKLNSMHL